jgi:hypothetical protein
VDLHVSATLSCLVGVGRIVCLAELLDERWSACPPHSVAWQELTGLPASLGCSAGCWSISFSSLLGWMEARITQTKGLSELSSFGLLSGSSFDTSPLSSDLVLLLELDL